MPTLNDFGDAAYARAVAQADALAAKLGIQKEIIYQFFNDTAHLPQSLAELVAWGNTPNKNYPAFTPRSPNGTWNVLRPGDTPGTLGAADPGFRHVITNNVDQLQRFQQVDPNGNIFGGSWDPAYNAAHLNPGATAPLTEGTQRSASAMNASNYVGPVGSGFISVVNGVPNYFASQSEAEQDFNARGGAGPGTSTAPPPSTPGSATMPGTSSPGTSGALPGAADRTAIVDANAYGNTETLRANIDKALRDYAVARTQEERNAAYLDLQRWQTELAKVQGQQKTVSDMATALLSAATTLGSRPQDYVKFNQAVSGGRDILDQISGQGGPVAAFGAPGGQVQAGSVWDLLGRLGMQYPQTPATPAGVLPGAPNTGRTDLPAVNVPGTPSNPGALGEGNPSGAGAAPGASTTGLPASYEQALRELDQAAGGQWGGNRTDRGAVAQAWWNADPTRRGKAMPAVNWG